MKTKEGEAARELANILGHPQGIRFVRQLLHLSGVWTVSFAGNDALVTAFNEGRRSMGLYLMELVRVHAPECLDELLGWREERLLAQRGQEPDGEEAED